MLNYQRVNGAFSPAINGVFFPSYHGKHMELNGTDKLMEVYGACYGKHMETYEKPGEMLGE